MLASIPYIMEHLGKVRQATRKTFVVPVVSPAASTVAQENLAVGQLGLLEIDDSQIVTRYSFTTAPKPRNKVTYEFQQGVFKAKTDGMLHNPRTSQPKRTKSFRADNILRFYGKRARKATGTQKIAVGWDGVNADKNLDVKRFRDTVIYMRLTGAPVNKITGHTKGYRTSFLIPHECYDECEFNGETNPLCLPGSSSKAADWLVKAVKDRTLAMQGTVPLANLIRVTKIDSNTISGLTTFDRFELVVPDEGTQVNLGSIQKQYPTLKIHRASYELGVSTYQITVPDGTSAPAAATVESRTILADCDVCPPGYTKSTSYKKFLVTLPHNAPVTKITGTTGYSSHTVVTTGVEGDVYLVRATAATAEATFITALTTGTNAGDATYAGVEEGVCTETVATTYTWASAGSVTAASKTFKITLADDECGTSRLAALQAAYPGYTITGDASAVNCSRNYLITVYSDTVEDGCFPDVYEFNDRPAPFEGSVWEEVISEEDEPDNVGVIFEGRIFPKNTNEALYDYLHTDADSIDGVHIEISTHNEDYTRGTCYEDIPVTKLSDFTYPSGEGWYVRRDEEASLGYENQRNYRNPALRAVYAQEYFSRLDKFYDTYYLEVETDQKNGAFDEVADHRHLFIFYYEVGKGKEFENLVNALIGGSKSNAVPFVL